MIILVLVLEIYIPLCKSVEIRVNPWPFNNSFKSYLVDGSQRMLRGGLSATSADNILLGTVVAIGSGTYDIAVTG